MSPFAAFIIKTTKKSVNENIGKRFRATLSSRLKYHWAFLLQRCHAFVYRHPAVTNKTQEMGKAPDFFRNPVLFMVLVFIAYSAKTNIIPAETHIFRSAWPTNIILELFRRLKIVDRLNSVKDLGSRLDVLHDLLHALVSHGGHVEGIGDNAGGVDTCHLDII